MKIFLKKVQVEDIKLHEPNIGKQVLCVLSHRVESKKKSLLEYIIVVSRGWGGIRKRGGHEGALGLIITYCL